MPLFIAFWAPDNTPEQWASMFYLIAGVIVITQIPFIITAKAEPSIWTKSQGSTISTKFSIPNLGEQEEKEKLTKH
uniref:Uncharacterized protein n=1 Tax=Acrobeloides nanus TaxID=290746 RepID=A0A914CXK8_9BILA